MGLVKVKMWVWHPIDSYSFGFMSIGPPITEIQHFQNLTLNIPGQGHSWRSQNRNSTLSTHIPCAPCRSSIPGIQLFQNLTLKIQGQCHGWIDVESRNMGPTFSRFPCQSGIIFLSSDFVQNLTLKIKDQGHSSKSQCGTNILSLHIPFVPCQSMSIHPVVSEIWVAQSLAQALFDWQNCGPWTSLYGSNGQINMTLYNCRSKQLHETLNEANPYSVHRFPKIKINNP